MRNLPEFNVDPIADSIRFAQVLVSDIPYCRGSALGPKEICISFDDFSTAFPEIAGINLVPVPETIEIAADSTELPVLVGAVLDPVDDIPARGAVSPNPPVDKNNWLASIPGFGLISVADPDLTGIVRVPAAEITSL